MPRPLKPWFHKRKNCWVIEPGGKLVKLADGPKNDETRKQAEKQFHAHMVTSMANPPVDGQNEPTVASVIDAFLVHDEMHSGARTFYERKRYLQLFAEAHGFRLLQGCKAYHLTHWLDLHPEWSNPWTHSYVVRCVKRAFNWAVGEELIARNPFKNVKHRSGQRRRSVTQEEFDRLAKAADKNRRLVEVLRFIYLTGFRPSEVRMLRWSHLHFERAMIIIDQHKTTRTRKDHAPRSMPLMPELVRLLTHIRRRQDHPEFVFVRRGKQPWSRNGIQQNIRRLRTKVGLPEDLAIYGIRHLFGTRGILKGVDIKTLSELMGHSSTRMTEHYIHLAGQDEHLAEAMQRINAQRPSA
jgi:integrase